MSAAERTPSDNATATAAVTRMWKPCFNKSAPQVDTSNGPSPKHSTSRQKPTGIAKFGLFSCRPAADRNTTEECIDSGVDVHRADSTGHFDEAQKTERGGIENASEQLAAESALVSRVV